MARAPRDEFGTPFGQAGSAAAEKLGTPFGQAPTKKSTESIVTDVQRTLSELTPEYYAGIEASIKEANAAIAAAEEAATGITTPSLVDEYTVNPNNDRQVLYKGVPFNGMRNGVQFVNGYRQDLYNPDGSDRKNQQTTDQYTQERLNRLTEEQKSAERLSAYNILKMEFDRYGLGSLVENIKGLLQENIPASEFALRLRETPAYQQRFSANKDRISAGLAALSPAEYVALEDQYQNIMRNYGLPASYYTKDATGKQSGFDKFIAGDVSATELEDRIATAQKRVLNANPEVSTALKQFYPDISNGDILAYALDPSQALQNIKRKVTAAEIGGAAIAQGLQTGVSRAEELASYGVTGQQAQQGFQTVAAIAPRGGMLAEIYETGPYGQTQVEEEVFGLAGAAESRKRREKLTALETAQFSGGAGRAQGALGRDRALGAGQY